jgi:predicted enzyme related to lactoylglutathione lyase
MRFSGVMIGSENPTKLGAFYVTFLGEPGFHEGEWWGWNTGAQIMIGPHSELHGKSSVPQRVMLTIEVDDVKASFDEITSLGATVVAAPYQPEEGKDFWLATIEDVDGNYLQLATPWT